MPKSVKPIILQAKSSLPVTIFKTDDLESTEKTADIVADSTPNDINTPIKGFKSKPYLLVGKTGAGGVISISQRNEQSTTKTVTTVGTIIVKPINSVQPALSTLAPSTPKTSMSNFVSVKITGGEIVSSANQPNLNSSIVAHVDDEGDTVTTNSNNIVDSEVKTNQCPAVTCISESVNPVSSQTATGHTIIASTSLKHWFPVTSVHNPNISTKLPIAITSKSSSLIGLPATLVRSNGKTVLRLNRPQNLPGPGESQVTSKVIYQPHSTVLGTHKFKVVAPDALKAGLENNGKTAMQVISDLCKGAAAIQGKQVIVTQSKSLLPVDGSLVRKQQQIPTLLLPPVGDCVANVEGNGTELKRKRDYMSSDDEVSFKKQALSVNESDSDKNESGRVHNKQELSDSVAVMEKVDTVEASSPVQLADCSSEIKNEGDSSEAVSFGDCVETCQESSEFDLVTQVESNAKTEELALDSEKVIKDVDSAGNCELDDVLDWVDGVAELPGSDLKFRRNEFGVLEIVTDAEPQEDTELLLVDDLGSTTEVHTKPQGIEGSLDIVSSQTSTHSESSQGRSKVQPIVIKSNDEICCCEICGCYGVYSDYFRNGAVCGKKCMELYDRRARRKPKDNMKRFKTLKQILTEGDTVKVEAAIDSKKLSDSNNGTQPCEEKVASFNWTAYLDKHKANGAPPKLFTYSSHTNGFKIGMKLEGIDPKHPSLFCVLTVVEVRGYRIRLHFDGNPDCYDFWTNADSPNIFPCGWCEKTGHALQLPNVEEDVEFKWHSYLKRTRCIAAQKHLFYKHLNSPVVSHGFRIGSKLEAVDRKNTALVCVATVMDVMDSRFLVHFDGWDDIYDYWADASSPHIHPVGWCKANGFPLTPPHYYEPGSFSWDNYLAETKATAVPTRWFKVRLPQPFKVGMRLEAVDPRNPRLIRIAAVVEMEKCQLKLHFDGWSDDYDFWVDDDCPDIHPPGWCYRTGHPLHAPMEGRTLRACATANCEGLGHVKSPALQQHYSEADCPYSAANLDDEDLQQDRIGNMESVTECRRLAIEAEAAASIANGDPDSGGPNKRCPTIGCDGTGNVQNRHLYHYTQSGCPLAEQNQLGSSFDNSNSSKSFHRLNRNSLKNKRRSFDESDVTRSRRLGKTFGSSSSNISTNSDTMGDSVKESIRESVFLPGSPFVKSIEKSFCWDRHIKLLPEVEGFNRDDVERWSAEKVAQFVNSLPGCDEYVYHFSDEQIDGEAFLMMTQGDLIKILKIKMGPAIKIYNAIQMFNEGNAVEA